MTNETLVRRKSYPLPFHLKTSLMRKERECSDWVSPYCSSVVLDKKADNTFRFCTDFRSLYDISLFDAEPMPTIDEGNFISDKYFTRTD